MPFCMMCFQLTIDLLPYVQSCANPVIYSIMSNSFRRRLWLTWRRLLSIVCCCCWRYCSWSAVDRQRVDQRMVVLKDEADPVARATHRINFRVRESSSNCSRSGGSRFSFAERTAAAGNTAITTLVVPDDIVPIAHDGCTVLNSSGKACLAPAGRRRKLPYATCQTVDYMT